MKVLPGYSILREGGEPGGNRRAPRRSRWDRRLAWVAVWVYRLAALVFSRQWFQPSEAVRFSARHPAQFRRQAWTGPILVLGDNQIHHEFGEPDSISNMLDRWSEPSVRPPLTMLYGHVLLERELQRNAANGALPILHTGDAINVSCCSEFLRFREVIAQASARHFRQSNGAPMPFAMMPGNHDGFFMGNLQANLSSVFTSQSGYSKLLRALFNSQGIEWRCRCTDTFGSLATEQGVFNKNDFIQGYLELLRGTGQIQCMIPDPPKRKGPAGDAPWEIVVQGKAGGFFVGALARIVPQEPQRSYIVQLVRLPSAEAPPRPSVYLLLLDSANYPGRTQTAGMRGAFTELQMVAARGLWRTLGPAPEARHLLFGLHHNIAALSRASRRMLARLAVTLRQEPATVVLPACISAHRHRGGWYAYSTRTTAFCGESVHWTDLNASSMVDWPLARRRVALWGPAGKDASGRKHFVLVSAQELLFERDDLERKAQAGLQHSVAAGVLAERRAPLRRNPILRAYSILRWPLRDRYASEYAILHEMAQALLALIGELAAQYRVLAFMPVSDRLANALRPEPVDYESDFFKNTGKAIAAFQGLRLAVYDAWRWVDAVRRGNGPINDVLACAIAISALEDYFGQWRGWDGLPTPVADRWYRIGTNLDERYALVKPLRSAP